MDGLRFDVIPYSDLSAESTWHKLGRGSFGCVYKGLYLGLDVAIKGRRFQYSLWYSADTVLYRGPQ